MSLKLHHEIGTIITCFAYEKTRVKKVVYSRSYDYKAVEIQIQPFASTVHVFKFHIVQLM